jgi:hypothetical protein
MRVFDLSKIKVCLYMNKAVGTIGRPITKLRSGNSEIEIVCDKTRRQKDREREMIISFL